MNLTPPHYRVPRRGNGLVFPCRLATESASDRSTDLSSEGEVCVGSFSVSRYVSRADEKTVLKYTDGACLNNRKAN